MSRAKKWLWPAVMTALLLWTVYMLLAGQSPAELWRGLRAAHLPFLFLCVGLMLLYLSCEALSTFLVLRTLGTPAPLRRCLGYACVGFYFSTVTPSSTGGQPMQVYAMIRDGIPGAHGALDMLFISVCYQAATALYALGAWLCFPALPAGLGKGLWVLLLFGFVCTTLLTAGMVLLLARPGWCGKLADVAAALLRRLPFVKDADGLRAKWEDPIAQYAQGGKELWRRPYLFPVLLALSLLQLSCLYLVPWTVYRAFGLSGHNVFELTALQSLMAVAVGLLPLPGSTGAAETAFLQAFAVFFGPLVGPAVVLSRGISCYGMLVFTGVVALGIHLRRRRERLPASHMEE